MNKDQLFISNQLVSIMPVPVQQVEGGPVMENQMADEEVDLYKFPTPKWHALLWDIPA